MVGLLAEVATTSVVETPLMLSMLEATTESVAVQMEMVKKTRPQPNTELLPI